MNTLRKMWNIYLEMLQSNDPNMTMFVTMVVTLIFGALSFFVTLNGLMELNHYIFGFYSGTALMAEILLIVLAGMGTFLYLKAIDSDD